MTRRRYTWGAGALVVVGLALALVILLAAAALAELGANDPMIAILVAALLLTAATGVFVLYWRRRTRLVAEHEQARQAQWAISVAQSQEIARYHAMGPRDFEHALAFLCVRDGCTSVAVTGQAGDFGADVVAYVPDGRKLVIQAKRYGPTNKVGSPDMQRFGGTCFAYHHASVAAIVTTSTFTRQAVDYATRAGIRLVDVNGLAAWVTRTGPAPWH